MVQALEDKLQQLHKEKVGQLHLLLPMGVILYAYYQNTDKWSKNKISPMMQNIKNYSFLLP